MGNMHVESSTLDPLLDSFQHPNLPAFPHVNLPSTVTKKTGGWEAYLLQAETNCLWVDPDEVSQSSCSFPSIRFLRSLASLV